MNIRSLGLIAVMLGLSISALAQETPRPATTPAAAATLPAMRVEPSAIVRLWPNEPPATQPFDAGDKVGSRQTPGGPVYWINYVEFPSMAVYLPMSEKPTAAAIVCPGGGYAGESATGEGTAIAEKLAASGIAAFVLKYRLPDGHAPAAGQLPVAQQDLLRAIQLVRAGAEKFRIDPKRVGVIGFSAGGHLAATAATMYDDAASFADKAGRDSANAVSARPDFAVLMYPVITMDKAVTHAGSRQRLIGADADAVTEQRFSADLHVTARTPPLFIVHAKDDAVVPIANAERMNDAAAKAGVPHEFLRLERGGHGFGLGNNPETQAWFAKCVAWLRTQKRVDGPPE